MPIPIICPSCQGQFNAPDSAAGKKGKCPSCGGIIPIPEAPAEDEVLEAEDAAYSPFSDEDFDSPAPAADTSDRKPCPMCGELIMRDALKCRHCGEVFDPVLLKREQKSRVTAGDADLSTGEWVVAILCSTIGCIAGIVWMIQGKPKGKKMFLVSLCVQLIWGAIQSVAQLIAQ